MVWVFLRFIFLGVCWALVHIFYQVLEVFILYFFKYSLCHFIFLFVLWDCKNVPFILLADVPESPRFCSVFYILFSFFSNHLSCSIFKLSDSIFCLFTSVFEFLQWNFHLSCTLSTKISVWFPFIISISFWHLCNFYSSLFLFPLVFLLCFSSGIWPSLR